LNRQTLALAAALAVSAAPAPSLGSDGSEERKRRGEAVIRTLNAGQDQPTLEGLRREFPFLADAITGYALGEVWDRPVLDHRTRQIATVSAFAAIGNLPYMKIHAGYALNHGVTEEELKELVYLTTVQAGFPRAIDAAQALAELFAERRSGAKP
jgi:4-carboxymuconolactone decarboxylase